MVTVFASWASAIEGAIVTCLGHAGCCVAILIVESRLRHPAQRRNDNQ